MIHDRDYMRGPQPSRWMEVMWPDAVTLLVIINVVVFILQHYFGVAADKVVDASGRMAIREWGAFSIDALLQGRVWTLVTHMFVHQGVFHLLGNCLMIFFVGKALQSLIGTKYFLYVYFLSGVMGAALEMIVGWLAGQPHAMIGASGCAFGIFLALAVMMPQETITAMVYFIIPVRIKMWNLAMIFLGVSLLFGLLDVFRIWDMQIANFAHLGGALTGLWFMRLLGYGGAPVTYERLWHERQRREASRTAMAGTVRRRRRVVDVDEPDTFVPSLSKKEFIEREIDPLLDKIAKQGIGSLTLEERQLLERARQEIMDRENKNRS